MQFCKNLSWNQFVEHDHINEGKPGKVLCMGAPPSFYSNLIVHLVWRCMEESQCNQISHIHIYPFFSQICSTITHYFPIPVCLTHVPVLGLSLSSLMTCQWTGLELFRVIEDCQQIQFKLTQLIKGEAVLPLAVAEKRDPRFWRVSECLVGHQIKH